MHNKTLTLALSALAMFGMAFGCHRRDKDEAVINAEYTYTLAPGGSLSQALPGDADDFYKVVQAPIHATTSTLTGLMYAYQAESGFTGTDEVVLVATEQGKGGGRCGNNGDETVANVRIHINVVDSVSSTTRAGE